MESGKITQSEALDQFDLSASTLRRARLAKTLDAVQESTGRRPWLYSVIDLERFYKRRVDEPLHEDLQVNPFTEEMEQVTLLPSSTADPADIEDRIRLELDHERLQEDHEQQGKALTQARSDHEQEKSEREKGEREVIRLTAELAAARTIASDRSDTIDALKAAATDRAEKIDEQAEKLGAQGAKLAVYEENLKRRYRRSLRRAEKAAEAPSDSDD